jgi:pyrroline-5-carboxylate reductase
MTDNTASGLATTGSADLLEGARILFIGGGNMAGAMINGLLGAGVPAARIAVVEPLEAARRVLTGKLGTTVFAAVADIAVNAHFDAIVLAVKPQQAATALQASQALLARSRDAVLISIAAGLRVHDLVQMSGGHQRVVRAMPNTPALIGQGIAGLFAPAAVEERDRSLAAAVLGATGQVVQVAHENLIDTVTAVSGSGPAYAFYLMEAMIDAGVAGGLDAASARELALHTVKGAALLALSADEPPAELRRRVTSPAGTTAAAVEVLDRQQVRASLVQAIQAAAARSRQLSEGG